MDGRFNDGNGHRVNRLERIWAIRRRLAQAADSPGVASAPKSDEESKLGTGDGSCAETEGGLARKEADGEEGHSGAAPAESGEGDAQAGGKVLQLALGVADEMTGAKRAESWQGAHVEGGCDVNGHRFRRKGKAQIRKGVHRAPLAPRREWRT